MKHIITFLLFQFVVSVFCLAQESSNNSKIIYHEIDVRFIPEKSYMLGKAVIDLGHSSIEPLIIYLHGELNVDSIHIAGSEINFNQEKVFYEHEYSLVANKSWLILENGYPSESKFEIYYSGYFNPSKANAESDYMRISDTDGVLLRSFGYSLWFPVFLTDEKQDSYKANFKNVTIRTPKKLKAIVTGQKIEEYIKDNQRITIWNPGFTDIFKVQCTAREYSLLQENNILVYYLDKPLSYQSSKEIVGFSAKLQHFFALNYIGLVKPEPLYIIQMPEYGDISSGNVVGIQTENWNDFNHQLWPKIVLAHELVHSYVQLPVSQNNEFYAFVIEGFPSYFHFLALIEFEGEDWYNKWMVRVESFYLYKKEHAEHPRGWPIPNEKPILDLTSEDISEYKDLFVLSDRVLLFFNYLRKEMGEDDFKNFAKELFSFKSIDYKKFENLTLQYLPEFHTNLFVWLKSTDYPDRFHIN